MRHLISHLERAAPTEGMTATAVPFLRINRRTVPNAAHAHVMQPCIGIFVAGHKRTRIAGRDFNFRAGDIFALPRAAPTVSRIVRAPYVCAMLSIDVDLVAKLAAFTPAKSSDIAEPFARLVRLLESPSEIAALAPLVERELFYRLLAGPHGASLRELARGHDPAVAAAMAWLEAHYAEPFSADRLAAHVHTSVSALYARFKARTLITPLQYQKQLRLDAARRMLLESDGSDIRAVAERVGYASAAQFSRDYHRRFAAPPRRDIRALTGMLST